MDASTVNAPPMPSAEARLRSALIGLVKGSWYSVSYEVVDRSPVGSMQLEVGSSLYFFVIVKVGSSIDFGVGCDQSEGRGYVEVACDRCI